MKIKYLALVLLFVGCAKDPVEINSTNNPEIPVSLLFKYEGCRVYRFSDSGHFHYFTNCTETISTQTYSCGKSVCSYRESIQKGQG